MKFTLSWLKDHLETEKSVDEMAAKLNAIGLEVEGIEDPGARARRVHGRARGRSQEASQRRQAAGAAGRDRQGQAADGSGVRRANATAGMLAVFAPLGTYIPGSKITLEKKPVRGVVSNGMMCSAAELRTLDESDGILDLAGRLGEQCRRALHRCGGPQRSRHRSEADAEPAGLHRRARHRARSRCRRHGHVEAGAETRHGRRQGSIARSTSSSTSHPRLRVRARCSRAALVKGVKNGPSPAWLQNAAEGDRPAPHQRARRRHQLHLDRSRPPVARLRCRQAQRRDPRAPRQEGSRSSLASTARSTPSINTMCVIADDTGPLGFGGIMGGETTGSTEATTNVFIESAYFDPVRTATTGRKAGTADGCALSLRTRRRSGLRRARASISRPT